MLKIPKQCNGKKCRTYISLCSLVVLMISGCQSSSQVPEDSTDKVLEKRETQLYEISSSSLGFSGSVSSEGRVEISWLPEEKAIRYEVHRELINFEKTIQNEKIAESYLESFVDNIDLDGSIYRYRILAIVSGNEQRLIAKYLTFDTNVLLVDEEIGYSPIEADADVSYAFENKYLVDTESVIGKEEVQTSSLGLEAMAPQVSASDLEESQVPQQVNETLNASVSDFYKPSLFAAEIEGIQSESDVALSSIGSKPIEDVLQTISEVQEIYQARPHGIDPEEWEAIQLELLASNAGIEVDLELAAAQPESTISEPEGSGENEAIISILPVASFPGAEGHGANSIGGRGGVVVKVSNLNDAGPGSLREALMMTIPRIIVFDVSGTIALESRLELGPENSFVTVAGQTTPGDGITLRNHSILMAGVQHVVIRYLRIRHGCPIGCDISLADNVTILSNSNNIILDHISMTWAEDEVMEIYGSNINNVTLQWSLLAEGNTSCVDGSSQNLGPLLSGGYPQNKMTFANNYLAHTCYRNYLQDTGEYQFINNLNYNTFNNDFHFSQSRFTGSGAVKSDVVGQYFKEGPQTNRRFVFDILRNGDESDNGPWGAISIYLSDIVAVTSTGESHPYYLSNDPYSMAKPRGLGTEELPIWEARSEPMISADFPVTQALAAGVPAKILPIVGASFPVRDSVDERIVNDFYTLGIWSSDNIKRYPQLYTYNVRIDSDNDGMPDDWEMNQGLDETDASDTNLDANGDGYTNIENYINSLVPGAWVATE